MPAERQAVHSVFGDDDEQGEVDGVNAFPQDGPLPAALADDRPVVAFALAEERPRVLEIVAVHDMAKRLTGLERLAVAGIDVADLPLGNGNEGNLVNAVLPEPQRMVQAAAEHVGLEAGLAVQGDKTP